MRKKGLNLVNIITFAIIVIGLAVSLVILKNPITTQQEAAYRLGGRTRTNAVIVTPTPIQYAQSYYEGYYASEGYYQGYYEGYYQGSYNNYSYSEGYYYSQSYYQSYYQGSYINPDYSQSYYGYD